MWKIYKEVRSCVVNGYTIVVDNPTKGHLRFTVLTDQALRTVPVLPEGQHSVEFNKSSAGLVLVMPDHNLHTPSGQQLMMMFEVAGNWLNGQGYAPGVDMRTYEAMLRNELMMQGVRGGLGV